MNIFLRAASSNSSNNNNKQQQQTTNNNNNNNNSHDYDRFLLVWEMHNSKRFCWKQCHKRERLHTHPQPQAVSHSHVTLVHGFAVLPPFPFPSLPFPSLNGYCFLCLVCNLSLFLSFSLNLLLHIHPSIHPSIHPCGCKRPFPFAQFDCWVHQRAWCCLCGGTTRLQRPPRWTQTQPAISCRPSARPRRPGQSSATRPQQATQPRGRSTTLSSPPHASLALQVQGLTDLKNVAILVVLCFVLALFWLCLFD